MQQVAVHRYWATARRMTLRGAFEQAFSALGWDVRAMPDILVGLFDLNDWQPWLADAQAMLDALESRRVDSRRAAADRDKLAMGYALHRLLLAEVLDCHTADVPIARDAAGCPRLTGDSVSTSLSHSDQCVAVAIAGQGPVGVDVEPSSRARVMSEIVERVCHPEDTCQIKMLSPSERDLALLRLWVRKEAFLKAAGVGLQREMPSFSAPEDALLALPGGGMSRVRTLDIGSPWVAAVAGPPSLAVRNAWLRPAVES